MKTNRILTVLVALTLLMQVGMFFQQYRQSSGRRGRPSPVRDAPSNSVMETNGLPLKGSKTAKVILIEFSDYECPFCERHANGVGKELDEKFVSSGQVSHVFVNNPLPIHPNAKLLATSAICAGEQNHYWEMHDALFEKKPKTKEQVVPLGKDIGLDVPAFEACVEKGSAARIESEMKTAQQFGLTGTPAFAIGRVDANGKVSILKFLTGALPMEEFEKALKEAVSKANA